MVIIASGSATSVSANSTSTDQVTGTFQFLPSAGTVSLYTRASATGLNVQLIINGFTVVPSTPIPWTGTAGALTRKDHGITSQYAPAGSRCELKFINTTGGAITTDYLLELA